MIVYFLGIFLENLEKKHGFASFLVSFLPTPLNFP